MDLVFKIDSEKKVVFLYCRRMLSHSTFDYDPIPEPKSKMWKNLEKCNRSKSADACTTGFKTSAGCSYNPRQLLQSETVNCNACLKQMSNEMAVTGIGQSDDYQVTYENILKRIDKFPLDNRGKNEVPTKELVFNKSGDNGFLTEHYDIIHFNPDDEKQPITIDQSSPKDLDLRTIPEVIKNRYKNISLEGYIRLINTPSFRMTPIRVCLDCFILYNSEIKREIKAPEKSTGTGDNSKQQMKTKFKFLNDTYKIRQLVKEEHSKNTPNELITHKVSKIIDNLDSFNTFNRKKKNLKTLAIGSDIDLAVVDKKKIKQGAQLLIENQENLMDKSLVKKYYEQEVFKKLMLKIVPKNLVEDRENRAKIAKKAPFNLNYEWFGDKRLPKYFRNYEISQKREQAGGKGRPGSSLTGLAEEQAINLPTPADLYKDVPFNSNLGLPSMENLNLKSHSELLDGNAQPTPKRGGLLLSKPNQHAFSIEAIESNKIRNLMESKSKLLKSKLVVIIF